MMHTTEKDLRLCIVINPAFALTLCYEGQYEYLQGKGYEITAVAGPGDEYHTAVRSLGVKTHVVPMRRNPSPFHDLGSIVRLWWFFRKNEFDIIQVSTPKAAMVGALSARLAKQKRIVYLVRGRPYELFDGVKRWVMSRIEKLVCSAADVVIPVSTGLGTTLVEEGLCAPAKIRYVGDGSSSGVDINRFAPSETLKTAGRELRREAGIPDNAFVILYVGWIRRDKGVEDLLAAFLQVQESRGGAHVCILGDHYDGDRISSSAAAILGDSSQIHLLGRRLDTEVAYSASDLFVLPSYREGFPRTVLEASAAGLPVVTTDAPGCRDSVLHRETGLVVPVGDRDALAESICEMYDEAEMRMNLGNAGRSWAIRHFRQEVVWQEYEKLFRFLCFGENP